MKKNIKSSSILAIVLMASLLSVSCTKNFPEYNTNPDEATEDMLEHDNFKVGAFIPQLQQAVIPCLMPNHFQVAQNLTGDNYAGYMCGIGVWNSGKNGLTGAFAVDDWLDIPFEKVYASAMSADRNIRKNFGEDMSNHVVAFSTILKVAVAHRFADAQGPLPYSKMAEGGSLQIEYDSEEALYRSFFEELTNAINVLTEYVGQNADSKPMANYDLVYDGDYKSWIKYANSLKLRLAMRVRFVEPELAKQMAEEAVNHQYGVILSNSDNATLKSGHGIEIKNQLEVMWNTYADCRMGAVMDSYLNGYEDSRLPVYFQKATTLSRTGYVGGRTGVAITGKSAWEPLSSPNVFTSDPITWFNAAESYFLIAEGALAGWNMGMTAQAAYQKGIEASFEERGISGAASYINNSTSTPAEYKRPFTQSPGAAALSDITIKWDETATDEKNLERIITQKWIAIFPNGNEAWAEYRRTGYPKQFPMVSNHSNGTIDSNKGPRRLPFPPTEKRLNGENVDKAVQLLSTPADNGGTRLWWDVR